MRYPKIEFKNHNFSGKLITFCGLDGCGKTTMIKKLSEYLKSKKVEVINTKQPTDTIRESTIFRTYMDEPDHSDYDYRSLSLLAASDRIQHNLYINKELECGKIIISDRYFYSCLANLRARGYKNDKWIYEIIRNITKPDIAFFLDIPVPAAIRRIRERKNEKFRYIDIDLQNNLRKEYLAIARSTYGIIIKSDTPPDETFVLIKKEVDKIV